MKPINIHRRAGAGASGPSISVPVGTYTNEVVDPSDATCTIDFRTDGTCAVSAGTTPSPSAWRTGGGAGSDYDISFNNGSTWANLGTNQTSTVNRTTIGTTSATRQIKIRRTSDSVVVASGDVTLVAIVD